MPESSPHTDEKRSIVEAAAEGIALGNDDMEHLSNAAGASNYIRIADEVKKARPHGRILDWGCGYGQMTYLLGNRGLDAVAYEVGKRPNIEKIKLFSGIDFVYGGETFKLPFGDSTFEAALSCGTLEHVPHPSESLAEINRVLKDGGKLFIYMLPSKYSYAEWLADRRGISVHPVKYTPAKIRKLLEEAGFSSIRTVRSNFFPKNLTGLPKIAKKAYGAIERVVIPADKIMSRIPLLNLLCGVLEVRALKTSTLGKKKD